MKIGSHEIGKGAFLAPMAGITNPPFRQLCIEMGAAATVTELVSSHALVYLNKKQNNRGRKLGVKTLTQIARYPGESPFAIQIFGREPLMMAEAAKIIEQEGADIIDLNFGCPAKKVIKNGDGCGVALMRDPELLSRITAAVVNGVSIPVTAKTRLGWSGEQKNGPEIAKRLEDAGVQAICIHARTRDQGHCGPVDMEMLAQICDSVSVPVIGNGGIRSKQAADEMIKKTGCARVSVGQGAKGNPWIFSEILGAAPNPGIAERIKTCRRHLDLYVNWDGEPRAVLEMRKHASWYLKGFAGAAALRGRLGEAINIKAFNDLLDEIPLDEDPGR